jgi:chromosome segregation ATPase
VSEIQTGGVSDDPGRIIYELDEKVKAANAEIDRLRIELQETYAGWSDSNSALADQATEIERLKAEWQSEFTAAQQLRAENESLTVRLQRAEVAAAEALQRWETTEQVCLKIITALAGVKA